MVEYQIVLNVYVPAQGGRTVKQYVRGSDRESMVRKFQYLSGLLTNARGAAELSAWARENLNVDGRITGIDGLYGVASIKIM